MNSWAGVAFPDAFTASTTEMAHRVGVTVQAIGQMIFRVETHGIVDPDRIGA
jgi:hypothetical protein